MTAADKDPEAFRTIGELSEELGVAQHILRYWETKFSQLRPLQRAGNRRYYRPADVALARRIHNLLSNEGYTVRGVQKLLREQPKAAAITPEVEPAPRHDPAMFTPAIVPSDNGGVDVEKLIELRDRLRNALTD
ncbi:MerR family transcriptional regulator [Sphingomonas alba]|uniref:MerR family transcriptional regulator n=1 Tax=Sphingomonas alba TaxID=2908208 RepID=A0ABT0RR39_9SPHN|nr:MerR family transcriptional regulator [Sphingomonas alba]